MQCVYKVKNGPYSGQLMLVDMTNGKIRHYEGTYQGATWSHINGEQHLSTTPPRQIITRADTELVFHSIVPEVLQTPATPVPHDGKDDKGKPDPSLLFEGCAPALAEVCKVLDNGAKKYAADSWQQVPDGINRYRKAFYRHLAAVQAAGWSAINEADGGQMHIDHMITDLLFIRTLMLKEQASAPK